MNRWENGIDHHPMSQRLMSFLLEHDLNDYNDYFCWKKGGDGDNGETLMFEMDAFFETMDKLKNKEKGKGKVYFYRQRIFGIGS